MEKEYLDYLEEKRNVFNLLISYRAFERLILSNYPFEAEWIIKYFETNRHLNLSEQIWFLNLNKNLKIGWKEMYDLLTKFGNYSGLCHNKSACESLKSFGIEIHFSQNEWEPKLPKGIVLNDKCKSNDLSNWLEKENIEKEYFFESKEIWNYFFKEYVDEEMIIAWTYKDTLNKEIERCREALNKRSEDEMLSQFYENQKMAQTECDENEDNIIDQAFEGDADNVWNID